MLPLRLCYLKVDCFFDQKCNFARAPFKDFTDTMLSGFNVSLLAKPGLLHSPANDESKAIDECLLSLQKNESDVVLLPYTIPLIMSNIKTGPVFFSDKIAIVSTYGVENDDSNPRVFDTFNAFSIDTLVLSVNFFVILAVLIGLTYIFERKSLSRGIRMNGRRFKLRFVPWFIFRFFVKQFPSFPGNMTAVKVILTCCLLLFSYFVTFFYTSMIKTDMVTVKTPLVIASYQDILNDPEISPYIRYVFDEYSSFKKAPVGSLKRKIWERIVKMGVNRLVFNDDVHIPFLDSGHPFMHTKAVIILYTTEADVGKYFYALHFKKLKIRKTLYVSDPTESEKLSASVVNRLTDEIISHKYEERMKRFFQGHFYRKFLDNAGLQNAQAFAKIVGMESDISDADQYVNQRVVLPEPELVKPNITYFMPLFISYLVLYVIQFIVVVIEKLISKVDKNIVSPSKE